MKVTGACETSASVQYVIPEPNVLEPGLQVFIYDVGGYVGTENFVQEIQAFRSPGVLYAYHQTDPDTFMDSV